MPAKKKLPPVAQEFRETFYKNLADKKRRFVATLNARFATCDPDSAESGDMILRRYCQEMEEINRVYGRTGTEENQYLIGFGQNEDCQLGVAISHDGTIVQVKKFSNCRVLDAGGTNSAVVNDGRPYVWGSVSENGDDPSPQSVRGFPAKDEMRIVDIGMGDGHCIFLGMSGDVYSRGFYKDEDSGEFLDTGDCVKTKESSKRPPQKVDRLDKAAVKIFANANVSAAILEDGSLVTWGMSNTGSLARTARMSDPDDQGNYDISKNFYTRTDGEKRYDMEKIREHFMTPKSVLWSSPSIKPIVQTVAIGFGHILVTAFDLSKNTGPLLYAAGTNAAGQLGTNDNVAAHHSLHPVSGALKDKPVASIAAGMDFSIAVTFEGQVYGFGDNSSGQLGIGFTGRDNFPTPQSIRFKASNPVVVVEVAAGGRFALARAEDGSIYSWGENTLTQTGHVLKQDKRTNEDLDECFPSLLDLSSKLRKNVKVVRIAAGQNHVMVIAKDIKAA